MSDHQFREATWPQTPPDADVTTWVYEEATGLLVKKVYDDATEQDPSIIYTYTTDGKLASRQSKRLYNSQRLKTEYDYDDDTGELVEIDYADSTPAVTFTHNRPGQKVPGFRLAQVLPISWRPAAFLFKWTYLE